MRRGPDYGIDAPGVVRALVLLALAGAVVALVALGTRTPLAVVGGALLAVLGVTGALAMVTTSKVGKLRVRDRVLELAALEGDEVLLDVGCGRGLLLVAAAELLPAGEAVGVDVWSSKDLSANTPAGPLHNARLSGVRVRVETADARDLPFDDDTFDVVVSSFALHNLASAAGRRRAMREVHRVLKPLGRLVVADIARTDEYVRALRGAGWRDVARSGRRFSGLAPLRYVVGTKPP